MHLEAIQFSKEELSKEDRRNIDEEKPGKPCVIKHLEMVGLKYCKDNKHKPFDLLKNQYAFISKIYARFVQLKKPKYQNMVIGVSLVVDVFPVQRLSEKSEKVSIIRDRFNAKLGNEPWFNPKEWLG